MPASREVRRDHDDFCERNKQFNYHDWESWFSISQRVNSEGAAEESGGEEESDNGKESDDGKESDGDAPIEDIDVPMEGMDVPMEEME